MGLTPRAALAVTIRHETDGLDGVFLNAGLGQFGPVETLTPTQFDAMFSVNVRGPFFQLQALLPLLRNPSSVVLNASVAGILDCR